MRLDRSIYILAFACALIAGSSLQHALVDDSFIFLRVAEHIAKGEGWQYNIGEISNPCSSYLYPLLLSGLLTIGFEGEQVLLIAYALSLFVLTVGIWMCFSGTSRVIQLLITVIVLCEPVLVRSAGMETALFLALVVWSGVTCSRGMPFGAGLLAALAALCRVDGLALFPILLAAQILSKRKGLMRLCCGYFILLIPALIGAYLYFGSLLPNSLSVKFFQSHNGWWAEQGNWVTHWIDQLFLSYLQIFLIPCALYLILKSAEIKRLVAPLVVIAFGLVQAATYTCFSAPVGYYWYYAPGNLAVYAAILLGAFLFLREKLKVIPYRPSYLIGGGLLFILCYGFGARIIPSYPNSAAYRVASTLIRSYASDGNTVASMEIGYLGYFTGLKVIDPTGLASPQALNFLRTGHYAWWLEERPDFVVSHEPAWQMEPEGKLWKSEDSAKFLRSYKAIGRSDDVLVWRRDTDEAG
ncbi:MAG: hypothetical protein K1X83_10445 [Oligoflexia bacterium]|nr:hypothetical protein [Oligoflexia bacterium]